MEERTEELNRGKRWKERFHFVVDQSGFDQSEFSSSVLFDLKQAILLLCAVYCWLNWEYIQKHSYEAYISYEYYISYT